MQDRRDRRLGAALLLLVVLSAAMTACDGSAAGRDATPHPSAPAVRTDGPAATRSPSSHASDHPGSAPHLGVRRVLTLHTPYTLGPLAMQGEELAAPAGADRDQDRVAVLAPGAERLRIVARSGFPEGFINWVAVSGDWVAWVDQSHRQSDADPDVLWRVRATNLETGRTRLLVSNGRAADPFVPEVHGAPAGLFWTQAEPDRTARERFWRPGARAPVDLMRHVEMTPGSETFADGGVVFLGPSALPHRGHTVGGDCWTVSLRDHRVAPLTRTGLAMGCAAAGQHVTWTEHVDPHAKLLPADGVLDDPYEVRVRPLDGGAGRLLRRGYLSMGHPRTGRAFTVWPTPRGALLVRSLTGRARSLVPGTSNRSSSYAASGDRLAVVSRGRDGDTVEIVRVTTR